MSHEIPAIGVFEVKMWDKKKFAKSAKTVAFVSGIGAAAGALMSLFENSWRTFGQGETVPVETWISSAFVEAGEIAAWGFIFAIILVWRGADNSPQKSSANAPIPGKLSLGSWLIHSSCILITLPLTLLFLWSMFSGTLPQGSLLYKYVAVVGIMGATTLVFIRGFLHDLAKSRGRPAVKADHDAN